MHTGGMIALIPRDEDLAALAVDGGDPVEELHLTLAYLGDDVSAWPEGYGEKLKEVVAEQAAVWSPMEARVFAHAAFNPDGGPDGDRDPCAVYLIGDHAGLGAARAHFATVAGNVLGTGMMPEQHEPFVPHVTAGYGVDASTLAHTGPVVFDRVRLALGGENFDYPLTGADPEDQTEPEEETVPELKLANEEPLKLPVMAVEGWETSDGRYIEPGALTHRALPIPILAQTVNPVGGEGHDGAEIIGRVDSMTKVPGPEVINKQTGEPFPEGTFVWSGEGVIDPDTDGGRAVAKRYLTGNSIDLAELDVDYVQLFGEDPDDIDDGRGPMDGRERTVVTKGVIAATTLCAIPAFGEAYVELGGEALVAAANIPAEWLTKEPVPMWRSGEIDDTCAPCAAGLVASGAADEGLPAAQAFRDPEFTGPTPLLITEPTVTGHRLVLGHLATWGTCHIGFAGQCITPPRSASDYAYFRTGAMRALDESGDIVSVPVGALTVGQSGHAAMSDSASAAVEHYDVTGTAVAYVAAGEDEHGVWVAGVINPGTPEAKVQELAASALSGDWRRIRGSLELVAALAVNVPGFPVPRARVASGSPLALVAAGAVAPAEPAASGAVVLDYDTLADALAARLEVRQMQRQQDLVTRREAALAFARLDAELKARRDTALLTSRRTQALGELAGKKGGGPIPKYMKRIADHLMKEEGYDESRAIATAVNAAKKMCSTGDTNWPGKQQVNPGSQAEACAAVAQWEKRNAG